MNGITVEPGEGRKRPIGCKRDALRAAARDGKLAGEGGSKSAFLFGNVVYKVTNSYCLEPECDAKGSCSCYDGELEDEFIASNRARVEGFNWGTPTSLYKLDDGTAVIAQPRYITADSLYHSCGRKCEQDCSKSDQYYRLQRKASKAYYGSGYRRITDFHPGNYGMTKNGQLRVFDGYNEV